MKTKLLNVIFVLGLILSSTSAKAGVTTRVLTTSWGEQRQDFLPVQIKNVDHVEYDIFHMGTQTFSYALFVYVWTPYDLGTETKLIDVVDVLCSNGSLLPAYKVGYDHETKSYVYLVKRNFSKEGEANLYATITINGIRYYSNQGRPQEYFAIHF